MVRQATEDYIKLLPKAEVHLHLEGSVSPSLLKRLAEKYETELAEIGEDEIRDKFYVYDDFHAFLKTFGIVCEHLRSPDDYLLVWEGLEEYLLEENILYAEVFYTPSIPWKFGVDGVEILEALVDRAEEAKKRFGLEVRWILDNVRQFGPEPAARTVHLGLDFHPRGVVGIGIGGDEQSVPLSNYEGIFNLARANQLFVHAHAGEVGEPSEVWDALRVLGANRIGHGIQSARDPKLMEYLRERAISLDICLTSNTKTKAWPMISDHPLPLLIRRGVSVTLNSDDPGLFETSLGKEYALAVENYGLSHEQLQRLILQAVRSAFLPHEEKMEMMGRFQRRIQSLNESLEMEDPESSAGLG